MAERPKNLVGVPGERQLTERMASLGPSKEAEASRRFAGQLFDIGNTGQDMLDRAAVDDATLAGDKAGLDLDGFRPRRDHTLSAQAFNRAGVRSFISTLETDAGRKQAEYFEQFKNEPDKLQDALNGHRIGIESQLRDQVPEALADFRATYERNSSAYMRKAADEHLRVLESQAAATSFKFLEGLQERSENIAFNTRSDVEAATGVAAERERLIAELVEYGPKQGFEIEGRAVDPDIDRLEVYTPETMAKALANFDAQMIQKRIFGKFERAASKESFLNQFEQKLGDADLVQGLTIDQTNQIRATMRAGVRAEKADRAAAAAVLRGDVKDAITLLKKGRNPDNLTQLRAMASSNPELSQPLEAAVMLSGYSQALRKGTPAQLAAELERFDADPPGTIFEQAQFELVRDTKADMDKGLKDDWLTWGDQSGMPDLQLNELDFQNPESLAERNQIVARYEARYGRRGPVLTDDEADVLGNAWAAADGATRLGMAQLLTETLSGERASQTFDQLDKKNARSLAMMGAVLNEGDATAAALMSRGMDFMREDSKIIPKGTGNDLEATLRVELGNLYAHAPLAHSLAIDTAKQIYAGISASRGELDGILNADTAREALRLATGGIVEFRPAGTDIAFGFGRDRVPLIAPARGVTGEEFSDYLNNIPTSDIKAWGGVMGFTTKAAQENIRNGTWRLVPLERGRYGVTAESLDSNTLGQEFRPLLNSAGEPFVIDWNNRSQ